MAHTAPHTHLSRLTRKLQQTVRRSAGGKSDTLCSARLNHHAAPHNTVYKLQMRHCTCQHMKMITAPSICIDSTLCTHVLKSHNPPTIAQLGQCRIPAVHYHTPQQQKAEVQGTDRDTTRQACRHGLVNHSKDRISYGRPKSCCWSQHACSSRHSSVPSQTKTN
jgi:hypothetical protein